MTARPEDAARRRPLGVPNVRRAIERQFRGRAVIKHTFDRGRILEREGAAAARDFDAMMDAVAAAAVAATLRSMNNFCVAGELSSRLAGLPPPWRHLDLALVLFAAACGVDPDSLPWPGPRGPRPEVHELVDRPPCRVCGEPMVAARGARPEPGVAMICVACAAVSVFADDLTLRRPTEAEWRDLFADQTFLDAMRERVRVVEADRDDDGDLEDEP